MRMLNLDLIKQRLKDPALRRKLITALVLLALGFAAGSVLAHDKPPPPMPAITEPEANGSTFGCLGIDRGCYADHFIAGGVLGVIAGRTIDEGNKWRWADREIGCGVTCQRWTACLVPLVLKEVKERVSLGRWGLGSGKDMTANALGCALGLHLSKEF